MHWRWRCFRVFGAALAPLVLAQAAINLAHATVIRFETTAGNYDVRLFDTKTPLHAANILQYVNSNRYDGTFVHRSAKKQDNSNFVIQGGGYVIDTSLLDLPLESGWHRIQSFGNVTNEPALSNLRGTMALAKGSTPSSGSSEWFINLGDNSFLDLPQNNSFTVFGRVVGTGMTVVDAIANKARVNASVSIPNGPGPQDDQHFNTAFGEVPVNDLAKVQSQQDVLNDDVVRVIDVRVLNIPAGDYDFNGVVNGGDLGVWRRSFGSTTEADADGNGNGVVDGADFLLWQNTYRVNLGPPTVGAVPEPAAAALAAMALAALAARRRRS
jgi:MYXO-CTERM domain-containing protein